MSYEKAYLALRMEGPFQSWGYDSQFDYRKTGLFPTKSGVAGLCCAASGIDRGSPDEEAFLNEFRKLKMLAISVPRSNPSSENTFLNVRRLRDFHTVEGTRKAGGGTKGTHLTYRYFLQDAAFVVVLEGARDFLERLSEKLQDPIWGIWLGRKACIPSTPIFAGIFAEEHETLNVLLRGQFLKEFTHQREVARFDDGDDTLPDQPVFFGLPDKNREYAPRRIKVVVAERG